MNCAISINLSLKNQNFTLSGCKEIGIQQFEVEAKTQFLCFLHTSEKKSKLEYLRPPRGHKVVPAVHFTFFPWLIFSECTLYTELEVLIWWEMSKQIIICVGLGWC